MKGWFFFLAWLVKGKEWSLQFLILTKHTTHHMSVFKHIEVGGLLVLLWRREQEMEWLQKIKVLVGCGNGGCCEKLLHFNIC